MALPEAARIALQIIPGDPLVFHDGFRDGRDCIVLSRATPRHEHTRPHRRRLAAVLPLRLRLTAGVPTP